MLTYLCRMKNKNGFTLVEVVIVVAIIAIMSAVAVPNFIASQRRAEGSRHNEHARGFYFAVQNTLLDTMENDNTEAELYLTVGGVTRRRSTPIVAPSGTTPPIVTAFDGQNFFIYAETAEDGTFAYVDLTLSAASTFSPSGATSVAEYDADTYDEDTAPHNDIVLKELIDEIQGFMAIDGKQGRNATQGYYYAMFDSRFRVTMAYYSLHMSRDDIEGSVNGYDFAQNNIIDGRTFGAHPIQYSFAGSFKVPVNGVNVDPDPPTTAKWYVPITVGGVAI